MPRASVQGCSSQPGYCLRHFLLSLGFEVLCESVESDVAVLIGDDVSCGPGETARVVVADRRAAESCGGPLGEAARGLSPPDAVRVVSWRGVVFYGTEQLYIVLRELRRLLERSGLLYTTPPLTRDEILRYRPSRGSDKRAGPAG